MASTLFNGVSYYEIHSKSLWRTPLHHLGELSLYLQCRFGYAMHTCGHAESLWQFITFHSPIPTVVRVMTVLRFDRIAHSEILWLSEVLKC